MTMKWSEYEPEIEIHYGGSAFSETGSSEVVFNSAVY